MLLLEWCTFVSTASVSCTSHASIYTLACLKVCSAVDLSVLNWKLMGSTHRGWAKARSEIVLPNISQHDTAPVFSGVTSTKNQWRHIASCVIWGGLAPILPELRRVTTLPPLHKRQHTHTPPQSNAWTTTTTSDTSK